MNLTLVSAVNDRSTLQRNLLASPGIGSGEKPELLIQEGFTSAASAYNDAIDRSANDLIVFLHQDMYLPFGWLQRMQSCIAVLDRQDPNWGVAGCWGATQDGRGWGHVHTPKIGIMGSQFKKPIEVQTLDEIVLILRRSGGLRFDEGLPGFHFYGAHLCLSARRRGLRAYAISAFCIHNSNYRSALPKDFYDCYRYVKRSWPQYLPIQTPCIRVTSLDMPMRLRRIKESCDKFFGRARDLSRVDDPSKICPSGEL